MSLGRFKSRSLPRSSVTTGIAVDPIEVTLTANAASRNAGQTISWTLALDWNGNQRVPVTVEFRGQSTSLPGAFVGSIGDALAATEAAVADSSKFVKVAGQTKGTLGINFTTCTITRNTVERTGQGDLVCSLGALNPTLGKIIGAIDKTVTIVDALIVPVLPVYSQKPAISGTPAVGERLTRVPGVVSGAPTPLVTWLWRRNGADIAGTTGLPSFTGGQGLDVITVKETAINSSGSAESESDPVTIQALPIPPAATRITSVQGADPPQENSPLFCENFTWTGAPSPIITRKWQRLVASVWTDIADTASSFYTPVAGDVGKTLRRVEIADNSVAAPVTAVTVATAVVIAAPNGALTDVSLTTDLITYGGAPDAFIAALVGQGGPLATVAFATGGNAGGRVKLAGTAPSFSLVHDSVAADFGATGNASGLVSYGEIVHSYDVTLEMTGVNGGSVTKSFKLRPKYPIAWPTGGAGGTEVVVSTLAALRAELQNPTTDPRIIRFDPAVFAVIETNANAYMAVVNGKKNWTLVGHRRVIFGKDGGLSLLRAENYVVINCAFRPGADPAGISRANRDCFEVRYGKDGLWAYCDFSWSIDELGSVIRFISGNTEYPDGLPHPVHNIFYRCNFYEALRSAGHSAGENFHPLGPLSYVGSMQTWWLENNFLGSAQRNPLTNVRGSGAVLNNLVAKYGTAGGYGGTSFASPNSTVEHNNKLAAWVAANLYSPTGSPAAPPSDETRRRSIIMSRVGNKTADDGSGIFIEPVTSPLANHLFYSQGPDLTADPYDPQGVWLRSGSTLGSLVGSKPFEIDGYTPKPTDTLAARQTIYNERVGEFDCVTGVREFDNGDPLTGNPIPGWLAMSKIGHDAIKYFAQTGDIRIQTGGYLDPPPAAYVAANDTVKDAYDTGLPA